MKGKLWATVVTTQGWEQNKAESLAGDLEKCHFGTRLSLIARRWALAKLVPWSLPLGDMKWGWIEGEQRKTRVPSLERKDTSHKLNARESKRERFCETESCNTLNSTMCLVDLKQSVLGSTVKEKSKNRRCLRSLRFLNTSYPFFMLGACNKFFSAPENEIINKNKMYEMIKVHPQTKCTRVTHWKIIQ